MKKQILFLIISIIPLLSFAQSKQIFPEVNYPTLDGSTQNSKELFSKKKLNIVVFGAVNGFVYRQMYGISEALDIWQSKYDLQVIYIGIENESTKPDKRTRIIMEKDKFRKDDIIVLIDEYIGADRKDLNLRYGKDMIGNDGATPHTLLIDNNGYILESLRGLHKQEILDQKVSDYFKKD